MIKRKLIIFISLLAIGYGLFPSQTLAQSDWANSGPDACAINDVATIKGISCLISNVLNAAIRLLGVLLFAMVIISGLKYLTAGGDPKAVDAAKSTLTAAITGLILAILAWFILFFIEKITGVKVTEFKWALPDF